MLAQVKYGVEDREPPFLWEEVDRFVEQHFPGAAARPRAEGMREVHFGATLMARPVTPAPAGQ